MFIYDENGLKIENPNLDIGRLEERERRVVHRWIVDAEEVSHEEVITEYANGGKDVAIIVDVPERGHWETRLADSGELIEFGGIIDDYVSHDMNIDDVETYFVYKLYTDEELENIETERIKTAEAQAKAEADALFLKEAPSRLKTVESMQGEFNQFTEDYDTVVCELYEQSLSQQNLLAEQDAAICELYELAISA